MVPVESIVRLALAQAGKSYVFGAEASAAYPSPKAFDCSELVKWACARAGVTPTMPDGTASTTHLRPLHYHLALRPLRYPAYRVVRHG